MLAQVKSGFSMGAATRGPPAPTFVGSSTDADTATIDMPVGIASGDIGVFFDVAYNFSGLPTDTLPAGWTRIGSTLTDSGGSAFAYRRFNMAYKVLDGTETTLTGMVGDGLGSAKIVLVFRKAATQTWGTPSDVEAQHDNDGVTDKTINVGAAPLLVVGMVEGSGGAVITMSPEEAATISILSSSAYMNAGYLLYGSGSTDTTITAGSNFTIAGFYVPLT